MAMLTPNKIRGYQFQQTGRGTYKSEEVDEFFGQVVESYEQVFKENGELVKKLSILATKLDEYRKEETSVRKALLNAQSFIDRMVEDAGKEAKKIVADAQERARNVDSITNAKIKVMVDEVEGRMRVAYEKATAQARQTKENAQKEAETVLLEAEEKANRIIEAAKSEAAEIISGATTNAIKDAEALKAEIEKEKDLLNTIKQTSNQFKKELVVLYERQIKAVEQMPDYKIDKKLENDYNEIVGADAEISDEVKNIVESFVENDDNYFDADDLIREYAVKDTDDNSGLGFNFDYNEEDDEINAEDAFSFNIDDEEIEVIENEIEEKVEVDMADEIEKLEAEIEAEFSSDVVKEEKTDEYEDIFSDSGNSSGFRFTAEDFEEINREHEQTAAEITEKLDAEDFDIFDETAEDTDIPVAKVATPKKFDIAFSDSDAVEIEKDEDLFLAQKEEPEEKEEGFRFFDDIDLDAKEDMSIKEEEIADAEDIFDYEDEDDDNEGFSFLKNIFGKK